MPNSNYQSKSTTLTSTPQPTNEVEPPISETHVNPIFWIMGVVFAVLLGIVFFVINALSVYL